MSTARLSRNRSRARETCEWTRIWECRQRRFPDRQRFRRTGKRPSFIRVNWRDSRVRERSYFGIQISDFGFW